ncbi:Probable TRANSKETOLASE [Taphrina deformans PYCC 5710]|uniref:Transketolase n=1 Tax=Taphrina deformans (strain PYCC 5710 / ATCC 11124 / CBS 356.35 / IMI 108563 / JCM 9778 / NBRC 8474) TaxID=1097556 RepID=R4XCT5_TAPDE|nr:Probable TRANSKETOLASE [Taphrina deformans PYCC 5710]|eukprot:CCG82218.1 Probable TRANSKETOLASE [Taphrina deformans PYCC 5710]
MSFTEVDTKAINTIRTLAVDVTTKSKSGHPGAPMGMAAIAHILFNRHMDFNPKNPNWVNRDRFVLSNGHGCVLQYVLLHLFGYKLSMDDLKNFRQLDSHTPGHPECADTEGIEVTTGPLGQGIANAVGIAMAEAHTAATYNKDGFELIKNYTYCFLGDGCMMEGISGEACSLAGHLQLGRLIAVYDDNHISIDGDTNCAFTEDVRARYKSYGWHVVDVENGDTDLGAMEKALEECKAVTDKPSLICLTTTIGYGSLEQGTHGVHGNPLKADDAKQVKKKFGFNPDESFAVPQEVYDLYHKKAAAGAAKEEEWNQLLGKYSEKYPEDAKDLQRRLSGKLPEGWEKALPTYSTSDPAIASRKLSETCLSAIQGVVPELFGGSADLTGSNLTRWKSAVDFQPPVTGLGTYSGRYVRYGVREHAMGAIMNGLASYGTILPYGGTFLNFVSYAAGAVRLSALSHFRLIWVATHDSIGLGEDGPTHQPIETLPHFRAMPNVLNFRPADGNEVSASYYLAMTQQKPSIISLSRQNLPQLSGSTIGKASKGGYVLIDEPEADITLVSTGSEVGICVDAAAVLKKQGIKTRIVSMPCTEIFDDQSTEYKLTVLPDGIPSMSVEVYSTLGWQKYTHESMGINRFGASAPYLDLYKKFGFTPEGIAERATKTVSFWKDVKPLRSPLNRAFIEEDVQSSDHREPS